MNSFCNQRLKVEAKPEVIFRINLLPSHPRNAFYEIIELLIEHERAQANVRITCLPVYVVQDVADDPVNTG